MSLLDKAITTLSPVWGVRRRHARMLLRAYEAVKPSRFHPLKHAVGSSDTSIARDGSRLRQHARHLEENHDLACGILDVLVHHIVGVGVSIEPQVKFRQGELACAVNQQLLTLFQQWMLQPQASTRMHWHSLCRLACRSWLRDGEVLLRLLSGHVPGLTYASPIPFAIELLEADFLPLNFNDEKQHIVQGVEKDRWGKPVAYHLIMQSPGDDSSFCMKTKRVSADNLIHLKFSKRCHQTRGVSLFASVLTRLDDLKQYEESERAAAQVAAAMTGFIKKPLDSMAPLAMDAQKGERHFEMQPGLFFDNLNPGEEVGMVQSSRPSNLLPDFRNAMLRAVAAGTRTSYSSIAKDYNGTYSAQRQELVEQATHYAVLRQEFVEQFIRPVWTRWLNLVMLADLLKLPPDIDQSTLFAADFRGPSIPWIDPLKEVKADVEAVEAGFKSRSQVIRERGGDPVSVCEQIKVERGGDKNGDLV